MDAMSGPGELRDRGLVADFYGLDERAEYRTERTGADGTDSRANVADWRTGRTGRTTSYWAEYRTGRTQWTQRSTESWTERTGADEADWWTCGLADAADYEILDRAD